MEISTLLFIFIFFSIIGCANYAYFSPIFLEVQNDIVKVIQMNLAV